MDRVERALKRAASGHEVSNVPEPASSPRGRWEDVDLAVYWALGDAGVEMAQVRHREFDWGVEYQLKTIEGLPATLVIERLPQPQVYRATATVGHFLGKHADRERLLIEAFERWMRQLGRKRVYSGEATGDGPSDE